MLQAEPEGRAADWTGSILAVHTGATYRRFFVVGYTNPVDMLLVQAESGEVVLVNCSPERHVVRGRLQAIDGQTWNNPCLSGNRLLVRNGEEAACYELPLAAAAAAVADGRGVR